MSEINLMDELLNVNCKATGIGSVPHKDIGYVSNLILEEFSDIPFWPQLTKTDFRESMSLQFSENLPCLRPDSEKKDLFYDNSLNREEELLKFYENLLQKNYEHFKIGPDYARGFYSLLEKSKKRENKFIKGQVTGPITFLSSIPGKDGKFLIYDEEMSQAIVKGLGMKAIWQAKEIRKIGKSPIIFYDEPYLSASGTANFPASREKTIEILNELIEFVKEEENILIGIHCCGNTDWGMIFETKIDILSFDAYGYSKYFVLYPDKIKNFLENKKVIAWGIVPTTEYNKEISPEVLYDRLNETFEVLIEKGIDRNILFKNSLFTPSCGMGLLDEKDSERIMKLCRDFSYRYAQI